MGNTTLANNINTQHQLSVITGSKPGHSIDSERGWSHRPKLNGWPRKIKEGIHIWRHRPSLNWVRVMIFPMYNHLSGRDQIYKLQLWWRPWAVVVEVELEVRLGIILWVDILSVVSSVAFYAIVVNTCIYPHITEWKDTEKPRFHILHRCLNPPEGVTNAATRTWSLTDLASVNTGHQVTVFSILDQLEVLYLAHRGSGGDEQVFINCATWVLKHVFSTL